MLQRLQRAIKAAGFFLGSRGFFWLVIAFFVIQAAWIALSATYPQAFDEDFHFGLIQAYSHYWLPFLSSPPPGTSAYGAMTRDPSFMYHFLMSFPYRLLALCTHSTVLQIVIMRFINIGLLAGGLILFRKFLRRLGISGAASNTIILLFSLIPIVPQVAGQVNYDNLVVPMTAWAALLALQVRDEFTAHNPRLSSLTALLTVCIFATLVKYEFAPIFLGIIIFVIILYVRTFWGALSGTMIGLFTQWKHDGSLAWRLAVLTALFIGLALFAQRDGINLVRYHTLAPDCGKVLTVDYCSNYPVWIHDYVSHQQVVSNQVDVDANLVHYVGQWVYWLWYRLFFAVNGPASSFANFPPLPLPVTCFALLIIASITATAWKFKEVFLDSRYQLLGIVIVIYLSALLAEGFLKYLQTGVLELMNGRYLLPVIIPGAAIGVRAIAAALGKRPQFKVAIALIAIVLFLDGGGVFTFISRSSSSWYWQNSAVKKVNHIAKEVLEPVLLDGPRYYSTHMWFYN